jgi:hypothetical protein
MKHTLTLALALIVLVSCTENDTVYTVSPELSPYVDAFYSDASAAGIDVPKNLIADLKVTQSTMKAETTNGQNYFYLNTNSFNSYSQDQEWLASRVYAGLGRLLLHKTVREFDDNGARSLDQIKADIFH